MNATHLQMDSQVITKCQQLKKTKRRQPLCVNLVHFSYKFMPFGLKNAPAVFSRIVVKTFQEYIYKTMAIYFDDWKIYFMLKNHYNG